MKSFNLSEWALGHRSFVLFLMIASIIAGVTAYRSLGREEDPSFAIKTMVVSAEWPGASIDDTVEQVTDRIEKEVQQIDSLDYTRSYTLYAPWRVDGIYPVQGHYERERSTQSILSSSQAHHRYPQHVPRYIARFDFNDEFGDVYGNIYAFTSDGLSLRQLRDYVEGVRSAVLHVKDIGKTELIGTQDETIYLDISARKLPDSGSAYLRLSGHCKPRTPSRLRA